MRWRISDDQNGEGRDTQRLFSVSVITCSCSSQISGVTEFQGRDRGNKVLPTVGVDQDLDHLRNMYIQKFMGLMKHMPASSGKWLMVNPVFP